MSSVRMPDATLGWVPFALAEGRRLLDSGDFHAIFSSSGPPSSHIVAARLQRRSGLPWIADYRDLWSDNHWDARIGLFRRLESRLERRVLRGAALVTTVAPIWARQLRELHSNDVEVVYNGFDPADYPAAPQPTSEFVLTYVGTLIRPGQDPEPLFEALALLARRPDLELERSGFQVRFLGTAPGAVADLAERHGVAHLVRQLPVVPHHESLAEQAAATALLFVGWRDPALGWLSAKLFEYLGARRPILAVGPSGGEASRILRECGMSDLSDDPQIIAQRLAAWLREFADSGSLAAPASDPAVQTYTRRAQARRLAHLLDGLPGRGV
jgi:glycosyltransferase involved in cell wall biosynthesis